MAVEVRTFQATIPAHTPQSAPVTIDVDFPSRIVESIRLRIPPGPTGFMGFQLWVKGGQVIPINPGEWIIDDDAEIDLTLSSMPDTGAWQVVGYNTGAFDHSVYVTFGLNLVTAAPPDLVSTAASNTALSSEQLAAAIGT